MKIVQENEISKNKDILTDQEDLEFFDKLKEILSMGWIKNTRVGNHGSVGNMLEDILGIPENNLPLPDISKWELKSRKVNSTALTTLFIPNPILGMKDLFLECYCLIMAGDMQKQVLSIQKPK